ncbi:MAG: PaaI family thioesterase [Rhodobacterales bacterium]|nr:PaaI family thioesterase [Rhodobacterales bacterium]
MTGDPASAGWLPSDAGPFSQEFGPVWQRTAPDGLSYGLLIEARHGNHMAVAYGGVVMALAEHAMAALAMQALGCRALRALQFDLQFLSPGAQGEMLIASGAVLRRSATLAFLRGEVRVGDRLVAAASGIWKTVRADTVQTETGP